MNLVYGLVLYNFFEAQVDRASVRCLGGHMFESCRGLRFFLCPTLLTCWSFHFHKEDLSVRQWSLPKYFASKAKWVLRRYYIFLAAGNKKSQRAIATTVRVWCKWIHTTIGWRKDEHGIHKHAHGSWILYCVSRVRSKAMDSLFCITS